MDEKKPDTELKDLIEKRLGTGESFKKVERDLEAQGYGRDEIRGVTRKSDHYLAYSAYSVLYALGILMLIFVALISLSNSQEYGTDTKVIYFAVAVIFLCSGFLASRSHILALYAGIAVLGLIFIVNVITLGIIAAVIQGFFLSVALRGLKPMKRIINKGHKVTRAF